MSGMISAIYENGTFRLLEPLTDLIERQKVQLFYVSADDSLLPSPLSVEEGERFIEETMGIWRVEDPKLRRWLAEEVSLFDDGDLP